MPSPESHRILANPATESHRILANPATKKHLILPRAKSKTGRVDRRIQVRLHRGPSATLGWVKAFSTDHTVPHAGHGGPLSGNV